MPTWLLKSCVDLLAPYITSLFNSSLSSGAFPTCYKDAYVTPRLKKPTLPPCELSRYRPISNLSFLSELLERVVSVQLTGYLSSAGLLPVHQSAYRRFHSTALDWLWSYLCDRRHTILYDGFLSTVRSLCCGVPQGSVIGPLLFLLYTADLGEIAASLGLSSHFYADDSQLYTWGPPSTVAQQRHRMELGIERITEWMHSNRLRLNPEKTDFMWCATRRRCMHLDTSELSVCGTLIRPSTTVRDLGVLLESDLSMRRHVASTVGCCFRQLSLIRSCIKSLPLGAAKAAVAAFVTSRVDRYNGLLAGAPSGRAFSRCSMLQRGSSATG